MKFLVVFPIADLRRLQKEPPNLVSLPDWSNPEFEKEHIRALGAMKQSSPAQHDVSGLRGWVAEPHFCNSASGLKFSNFGCIADNRTNLGCRIKSRRFFFDSTCCARLEFEFEVVDRPGEHKVSARAILAFLSDLKISIRKHLGKGKDEFDSVGFGRAGALFASALVERTGRLSRRYDIEDQKKSVFHPKPMIFMEAASGEHVKTDSGFRQVANTASRTFEIHHDRDRIFSSGDIPVWVVNRGKKTAQNDIRDFSLFLRRYYSNVEVSKTLITALIKDMKGKTGNRFSFDKRTNEYLFDLFQRVLTSDNKLTRVHHHASEDVFQQREEIASLASLSIFDFFQGLDSLFDQGLRELTALDQKNREKIEELQRRTAERLPNVEGIIRALNSDHSPKWSASGGRIGAETRASLHIQLDSAFDKVSSTVTDPQLVEAFSRCLPLFLSALENMNDGEAKEFVNALKEYVSELALRRPQERVLNLSTERLIRAMQLKTNEADIFRSEAKFISDRAIS